MITILLTLYLIVITIIDCKTKTISDGFTLLGIILSLNYAVYHGGISNAVMGINAGIGIVLLMNILGLITLGGGDAKLAAMIGSFIGWQAVIAIMIISLPVFYLIRKGQREAYSPYILTGFGVFQLWNVISHLAI